MDEKQIDTEPETETEEGTARRRRARVRGLIIGTLAAAGAFQLNGWRAQAHGNRSTKSMVGEFQDVVQTPEVKEMIEHEKRAKEANPNGAAPNETRERADDTRTESRHACQALRRTRFGLKRRRAVTPIRHVGALPHAPSLIGASPTAKEADRSVSLYLDEDCLGLLMDNGRGERSAGIFHRLTGRAYSLDAAAATLLGLIRTEYVEPDDVQASPAWSLVNQLKQEGIIGCSRAPPARTVCGVPQLLADFRLHRPLRNPAVAVIDASGRGWIIRNSDIATCRLPRTRWRPEILHEALDGVGVALLDLAAAGASWAQAEEALLSRGHSARAIGRTLRFSPIPSVRSSG